MVGSPLFWIGVDVVVASTEKASLGEWTVNIYGPAKTYGKNSRVATTQPLKHNIHRKGSQDRPLDVHSLTLNHSGVLIKRRFATPSLESPVGCISISALHLGETRREKDTSTASTN